LGSDELTGYLDEYLAIGRVPDYPNALNGLQVAREGEVRRLAFAVDAAQVTIDAAIREGADLLIVHHGLFWGGLEPLTGRHYRRIRALMSANLGLYAAHIPLDVHPQVGNNAVLARALGLRVEGTFAEWKGIELGVWGSIEMRRESLAARLDELLGRRVRLIPGGPEWIRRVGVITGGAGGQLAAARSAGLDAFITGEGAHHHYFDAMEGGVNLYFGGHYATETWGLRALSSHLEERFAVECIFLDHSTGL
jgi:dinuclear metal center YbgI/SA1388 family protein